MNLAQGAGSVGLAAVTALASNGTLVTYSGTMPANPETALSGNTALVTHTFQATAFGAPTYASGQETAAANFVANSVAPAAGGTASFMRMYQSGGTVVVADLTVGTTGADVNLASTTITVGVNLNLTGLTISLPVS